MLHVNDNYLTSLSGLEACPLLVEVQVARNDLAGVGAALAAHSHLTHLNLADNRICSFKVCVWGAGERKCWEDGQCMCRQQVVQLQVCVGGEGWRDGAPQGWPACM